MFLQCCRVLSCQGPVALANPLYVYNQLPPVIPTLLVCFVDKLGHLQGCQFTFKSVLLFKFFYFFVLLIFCFLVKTSFLICHPNFSIFLFNLVFCLSMSIMKVISFTTRLTPVCWDMATNWVKLIIQGMLKGSKRLSVSFDVASNWVKLIIQACWKCRKDHPSCFDVVTASCWKGGTIHTLYEYVVIECMSKRLKRLPFD